MWAPALVRCRVRLGGTGAQETSFGPTGGGTARVWAGLAVTDTDGRLTGRHIPSLPGHFRLQGMSWLYDPLLMLVRNTPIQDNQSRSRISADSVSEVRIWPDVYRTPAGHQWRVTVCEALLVRHVLVVVWRLVYSQSRLYTDDRLRVTWDITDARPWDPIRFFRKR